MKVCIVTDGSINSTYGGGQVYCRNIIKEFLNQQKQLDIQLSVISSESGSDSCTPFFYKDIPVYKGITEEEIVSILKKETPDIVHANGNYQVVTLVCRTLNIKSIVTIHDSRWICPNVTYLDPYEKLCSKRTSVIQCLECELSQIRFGKLAYPFVKKIPADKYIEIGKKVENLPFIWYVSPVLEAALKIQRKIDTWNNIVYQSDAVISISQRMARMSTMNGLPNNKLFIVHNGTPKLANVVFPQDINCIKFYYTGRISYSKGIHVLLKAFSSIHSSKIELHLIGGGGEYRKKLVKKYKRDGRIIWHDEVKHESMYQYIKDMHVFIHPSIANEACSLSILEALAAGKYVIATKCGGPEDLIVEDVNGCLIEPNDINQLRTKIIQYSNYPVVPKKIIFNDISKHIQQLFRVYSKVINGT